MTSEIHILINKCQQQDRQAQFELYRRFYQPFIGICLRYSTDKSEADDMLNHAFLRIFSRLEQFRGEGSFEGWMRRVVVTSCLNFLKKRKQQQPQTLDTGADEEEGEGLDTALFQSGKFAENRGEGRLSQQEMLKLVQELPPMSRAVFNLFVFENYPHKEIARMLDMMEGTSHWHLNNARRLLVRAYEKKTMVING